MCRVQSEQARQTALVPRKVYSISRCAACNLSKHDKLVTNPLDKEQRLLNCTEENEFPEHIVENANGQWEAKTKAGVYHLASIDLTEPCHQMKRRARRQIAEQIRGLCSQAIQYRACNPGRIHNQLVETIVALLEHLGNFPPLITAEGLMSAREWLKSNGVDVDILLYAPPSGQAAAGG